MEFESQVAKIQLGPEKKPANFVYIGAEKLPQDAESFLVAEILESDSALHPACQQIVLSIRGAIRRAFKKSSVNETFESAVAQVNEELAKLTAMGQTHWIDKLNCVIGVKAGQMFNIATVGKVAAYLLRGEDLADISCSAPLAQPLKTFENFASGKLKLGDVLILSTNQLFNHISIDRLKDLLSQTDFLKAAGQLVEILKANAEKDIALGAVLSLQAEAGTAPEQEVDLEAYIETAAPARGSTFLRRAWEFILAAVMPGKGFKAQPSTFKSPSNPPALPTRTIVQKVKSAFSSLTAAGRALAKGAKLGKQSLSPSKIRQFSPVKKFFFFSVAILLFAIILQLTTALYLKGRRESANQVLSSIETAKKALSDADTALLYKDEPAARQYYLTSLSAISNLPKLKDEQRAQVDEITKQGEAIKARLEKTVEAAAENLGTLAPSSHLIKLPEYLAAQTGRQIVAWSKSDATIRDDVLKIDGKIELAESAGGQGRAVIYDGEALKLWNYAEGQTGEELISSVPEKDSAVGLKLYPTNQRVYMLDKSKNQIFSFAVLGDTLGRPQVSVNLKNDDGKNARDLSVDGNIFVLTHDNVKKYHLGNPAEFALELLTPLNNPKKLYTKTDFNDLYVLDAGNKRILVLTKQGALLKTLTSKDFTDLVDFEVDEKNKIIYVLNGSSLLKVSLP